MSERQHKCSDRPDRSDRPGWFAILVLYALAVVNTVLSGHPIDRCERLESSIVELRRAVAAGVGVGVLQAPAPAPVPAPVPVPAPAPAPAPVPACVARLALYIARMEGYHVPGSLPRRQHNPGSLVYASQPGATRGARGYARFPTPAAGWAALDRDLRAKLARGYPLGRAWPYLAHLPRLPKGEPSP